MNTDTLEQELIDTNQTSFAASEPIFEKSELPEDPMAEAKAAAVAAAQGKNPKKKRLLLGSLVALMLIIISIGGLLLLQSPQNSGRIETPSPTPKAREADSELVKQVRTYQQRLEELDPTVEFLTLPPVNYELELEKLPDY